MRRGMAVYWLVVWLFWACMGVKSAPASTPDMIIIMLDGFRWDYLDIHRGDGLPGFEKFVSNGVRAKHLNPIFPTNSFPNWHTIVTGLYPESHGIVGNNMYDAETKKSFLLNQLETTSDPVWWKEAEPLWITATKNNKDTALFHWSRCDVPWEGLLPKYCVPYEDVGPVPRFFVKHLHQALDMIQKEGYKLAMVYETAVDIRGHYYGPDSGEVEAVIREVDIGLQGLWDALDIRGMTNTTNVVLLSDHGMTDTTPDDLHFLDVTPCLDDQQVEVTLEFGGYMNILPTPGNADQVVESLRKCPEVGDNLDVYRKKDLPDAYHFKAHRLIHEVVVIAKPGYFIKGPNIEGAIPRFSLWSTGGHGFDNTKGQAPDMQGVLYAIGPSFAEGAEVGAVEQVDVYGAVCRALRLSCHASDGSAERTEGLFAPPAAASSGPGPESGSLPTTAAHLALCCLLSLWRVPVRR